MKFVFKAKTKAGELKEGVVDASSQEAAAGVLQKNELFPISLKKQADRGALEKSLLKYLDRVTAKEQMIFFRQLAILIEARVPIVAALTAIKDQMVYNMYFHKIIEGMVNDIQDGLPLSDSLAKNKDVFSTLSISIIRAGEVSGNLRKSISYVADNIEKNYNLTRKVRSAMMYPLIVLIVFFIIAFIVTTVVVPKLTQVIKEIEAQIPWYTAIIITVSDFMAVYWWAVLVVIFGFIGGFYYYVNTDEGRREWDHVKLKLPIFGRIYQSIYISRFADNLAVLLLGGIPIIRALTVVSAVVNNSLYQAVFLRAADEVKIGGNMSDVFRKSQLIPPIVAQMVKIGEESGQVDVVLKHIATFYEAEADDMTKNLSTLIEPILMIVIGLAVGVLAFAVIMPIYNIAGQL